MWVSSEINFRLFEVKKIHLSLSLLKTRPLSVVNADNRLMMASAYRIMLTG